MGSNEKKCKLHRFTMSENITESFRVLLFDAYCMYGLCDRL